MHCVHRATPLKGRPMTDSNYINRLVDWIVNRAESETQRDLIVADLEFLGRRIDAVDEAGHKGAHATVMRYDAARFLASTYLLLGDALELAGDAEPPPTGESRED